MPERFFSSREEERNENMRRREAIRGVLRPFVDRFGGDIEAIITEYCMRYYGVSTELRKGFGFTSGNWRGYYVWQTEMKRAYVYYPPTMRVALAGNTHTHDGIYVNDPYRNDYHGERGRGFDLLLGVLEKSTQLGVKEIPPSVYNNPNYIEQMYGAFFIWDPDAKEQ